MNRIFRKAALLLVAALALIALAAPISSVAYAAGTTCPTGEKLVSDVNNKLPGSDKLCCPEAYASTPMSCLMGKYVNPIIKLLSVVAGVAVIGGLIWGGIQYGSSAGDAQKVVKGKQTITKALIGLVTFLLLASFIQFMSPVSLTQTSGGDCKGTFLGLKTWYAYIPQDKINTSTCKVSQDLPLLPTKDSVGVVPAVALAIVDDLLRIAAYIAVAFVLTGGIQYLTSQGEPGKTKQAMSTILNALIGLAIAVVAAVVVAFLGRALSQ